MDMFGLPAPDFLHIDDLLDFSNDDLFSDSDLIHLPPSENNPGNRPSITTDNSNLSTSFPNDLCVPVCVYIMLLLQIKFFYSLFLLLLHSLLAKLHFFFHNLFIYYYFLPYRTTT
uniref:Uncharacterized protein n=1 Tax=Nelumbo nucifera TaxID=4432 RepID=A0A822XE77_NELNU|nr:TPA_asm: hypothetical protein HUJ06_019950 [Nelumbo nucifera]